jgi:hypothetical protein
MASTIKDREIVIKTSDGDMRVVVQDITPKKARELLAFNDNNRTLRTNRVKTYASDMIAGNWKNNGVPIIIGDDGQLRDGQHRLKACVQSNKTLKNTIVVHLPQNEANCYDIGATRTISDIAKLGGLNSESFFNNTTTCAAMKYAIEGRAVGFGYSKIKIINEMSKHSDSCRFVYNKLYNVCSTPQKYKLRNASLFGAVINAYLNGCDIEQLERFCQVIVSGVAKEDWESPIIKIRDILLTSKERTKSERTRLYYQCQAALYGFINKHSDIEIKRANQEYYPYPDIKQRESAQNDK